MTDQDIAASGRAREYIRFDIFQRIEHIVFLISFTILGITGLVQKFATSPLSQAIIAGMGGIEATRQIHRVAAIVLLIVSIFHILSVLYRLMVLRVRWTMMPLLEDFKHLYHDVMYYFGLRKHKAFYGRYNYAEKAEYLAVVWGTVIMAITGFMMWNPLLTTSLLPGQFIPAAKAAHGGEAVLAVLAIIIWHFYHVHLRHFNRSMFTGKISEKEMAHEHPAELLQIKAGDVDVPPPQKELQRRKRIYFPVAGVLALALSLGVAFFVTAETTAITTVLPGETAVVFVPVTPTPRPTPTPAPSPTPGEGVAANTWEGEFAALFRNRCSTCHGLTRVGGLSLASYQDALAGGDSGPGIVPGNPAQSTVVEVQQEGGHPGQLSDAELERVIEWIEAGAPER
jgi:cytochrome b subunit of formate dehydrogenase